MIISQSKNLVVLFLCTWLSIALLNSCSSSSSESVDIDSEVMEANTAVEKAEQVAENVPPTLEADTNTELSDMLGESDSSDRLDAFPGEPAAPAPGPSDMGAGIESEAAGVLGFVGPEKGVSITTINWGQPVSQENPGADCEMRASKKRGSYLCIYKEGRLKTILNMYESGKGANRGLKKITLDAKGKATWRRWVKELTDSGFIPRGKSKKISWKHRMTFLSSDGKTLAFVFFTAKKNAVTVILRPTKAG